MQQSTIYTRIIQSPLVLIRSEREEREREKKREKKKEGKRTNKANTQTKQPWHNIPNNNIRSFLISIYELAKRNNVRISNIVVTTHLAVQYHDTKQHINNLFNFYFVRYNIHRFKTFSSLYHMILLYTYNSPPSITLLYSILSSYHIPTLVLSSLPTPLIYLRI